MSYSPPPPKLSQSPRNVTKTSPVSRESLSPSPIGPPMSRSSPNRAEFVHSSSSHSRARRSTPDLRLSRSPLSQQHVNRKRKSMNNEPTRRDSVDEFSDEERSLTPLSRSSSRASLNQRALSPMDRSGLSMQLETLNTRHLSLQSQFSTLQTQYQSSQRKVNSLGIKLQQTLAHISHLQHLNSMQFAKIKTLQKRLKSKNTIAIRAAEENKIMADLEQKYMEERIRREQVERELEEMKKDRNSWRDRSLESEKALFRYERELRMSQQQPKSARGGTDSGTPVPSLQRGNSASSVIVISNDRVQTQPLLNIHSKQMAAPQPRGSMTSRTRFTRPAEDRMSNLVGPRKLRSAGTTRRYSSTQFLGTNSAESGLASKHGFRMYRRASAQDGLLAPPDSTLNPWGNESPGSGVGQ